MKRFALIDKCVYSVISFDECNQCITECICNNKKNRASLAEATAMLHCNIAACAGRV